MSLYEETLMVSAREIAAGNEVIFLAYYFNDVLPYWRITLMTWSIWLQSPEQQTNLMLLS